MTTGEPTPDETPPPAPVVKRRSGPSLVWLIPLITALIGGWLVVKTLSERGPEITITFKTAEGIEAGKTRIMYKNLQIGLVKSLRFSKDFGSIILSAEIAREAEPFLRRDTRFWVVKPRLGVRGISGLGTLISGSFVEIEPGKGAPQRHFTGLETPPVVRAEEHGREIVLLSKRLGSLDIGSAVYYQGIVAGEVMGYELGSDGRSVFVHAFVKAPYDKLIHGNTRFWHASGLDVSITSGGLEVRTESVLSLLFGGIAFDTPDTMEPEEENLDGLVFTLYDSREAVGEKSYTRKIRFVAFFDGSVRGLNIGAPVEFKGIKIGSVADVRLEFDRSDSSFRIPVVLEIEPQRVIEHSNGPAPSPYQTLQTLMERGLRARLGTGSLLTGQLFVELVMRPDTPLRLSQETLPLPEIPTIPAGLDELTDAVSAILTKLQKVDIERIGNGLAGTLEGTDRLVNAPETQQALGELKASLSSFRSALEKVDRRVGPIADNLQQVVVEGRHTLDLMNAVLDPDSEVLFGVNRMTGEMADMAKAIRALVDNLERNPQSLLYGK